MASNLLALISVGLFFTFLISQCCHNYSVLAAPSEDLIGSLPNQPKDVPFKQYSGYVTVDAQAGRALFYYFVESEYHCQSKPLTLWLNGGPGCSSLGVGALTEIGPFQPRGNSLIRNKYSWNRYSNLLFVESPAGVGFSYSNNTDNYLGLNDMKTARDNLAFVLNWLEKFPEYKGRSFHITGESYAGHYIPQLSALIMNYMKTNGNSILNLKAIAIGNPALDWVADEDAVTDYYWSHGLNEDAATAAVTASCDWATYLQDYVEDRVPKACKDAVNVSNTQIGQFVNGYDVIIDVCSNIQSTTLHNMRQAVKNMPQIDLGVDVCINNEATQYLNKPEVQKAMHANTTLLNYTWTQCSSVIQYDIVELYRHGTVLVLRDLIASGLRVLIYSGDQDSVIPLTGTRTLVSNIAKDLKLSTSVPYAPWYKKGQVAGWTQVYGELLSYATIRGASHMVPQSQPLRALTLFHTFITKKTLPLQPPMSN